MKTILLSLLCCVPVMGQDLFQGVPHEVKSILVTNGSERLLVETDVGHLIADSPDIFMGGIKTSLGCLVDEMVTRKVDFRLTQDAERFGAVTAIHANDLPPIQAATVEPEPQYEVVDVVTYETVCEGGVCRQVRRVTPTRRLIAATRAVANAFVQPLAANGVTYSQTYSYASEVCPCGMVGGASTYGMADTLSGPPPVGFHDHTDSSGYTWRHEHWNNGSTATHVSPLTGEVILNRSADGGGEIRSGGIRGTIRGIRSRRGLRQQGQTVKLSNYAATGVRGFPLVEAIMPDTMPLFSFVFPRS